MKNTIFSLALLSSLMSCTPADQKTADTGAADSVSNQKYNEALATQLGADDFGMSQYVLVFLKRGPNRDQDSLAAAQIQKEHLANIQRLADERKLVLAGPFLDNGDIMGIYIFAVSSLEEAQKLTASDPAVKAGRLIMEMHPWYGSAALKQVYEMHKAVAKKSF